MEDITAKLNEILSDPNSMDQIKNIMNGMNLNSAPPSAPAPTATGAPSNLNLDGLSSLLGGAGLGGGGGLGSIINTVAQNPSMLNTVMGALGGGGGSGGGLGSLLSGLGGGGSGGGGVLSSLIGAAAQNPALISSLLQGFTGTPQPNLQNTNATTDMSSLNTLLSSISQSNTQVNADNINTILNSPAVRSQNINMQNDQNAKFLLALKPLLSKPRQDKVDESIKILRAMKAFPGLKDTGTLSALLGVRR